MSIDSIVDRVGGDPGYIKFLITERSRIRSALEARGVCLDEEARTLAYPTGIGNALHLDLIEVERWMGTLPRRDQKLLDDWATKQTVLPAYGGSKTGRINRLVREFISESQKEQKQDLERPDAGVPVFRVPADRGTTEVP